MFYFLELLITHQAVRGLISGKNPWSLEPRGNVGVKHVIKRTLKARVLLEPVARGLIML